MRFGSRPRNRGQYNKKTGASVGSDTPVSNHALDKFSVDAAAWAVNDLLDFKLTAWHKHMLLYVKKVGICGKIDYSLSS